VFLMAIVFPSTLACYNLLSHNHSMVQLACVWASVKLLQLAVLMMLVSTLS
jgi:hypothetical protein